jgi:glycosyltransferase involved in cell wall biosynthesis
MKIGLLICSYNRPDYLRQCLESLERADLSNVNNVLIIDDASNNLATKQILNESGFTKHYQTRSGGIKRSMVDGCDLLFNYFHCDVVINLDGDAIVRNDFVDRLLDIWLDYPNSIITGFHSVTKNKNGSERHRIINENPCCYEKESVGGINLLFSKEEYHEHVLPSLLKSGNWDHEMSKSKGGILCVKESVVEHIGLISSMGHNGDVPDTAANFKPLALNSITLIGVDCLGALERSCKNIKFAGVKLIDRFDSIEKYSQFIFKELAFYFDTTHVLIVQPDGWVVNWEAWRHEWLQYDYIGAVWFHHRDNHTVGNGGFSLRSRKLQMVLANDPKLQLENDGVINSLAEDHNICRIWRKYLEAVYDIKFAPEHVANAFSFEGHGLPSHLRKWNGQFGFHSKYLMKQFL